ncbi:hypothetical protein BGX20_002271 [Mortierella sp. AD010]|nr:hypothetical protein BGX20_002271 [Mortierella sp. AD010]
MEHIKECPRQIIPCSLSEFGCPWKGPRFDLDAVHIPQCPYEAIRGFLEISKSKMEALEQENQHLKGIFHDLKPQVQQLRDQVGQMAETLQLILQQEQQQAAGGNGGTNPFGNSGGMLGYMDMSYQQYHPGHHLAHPLMMDRNDSFDMPGIMDERINENEMQVMHRNSNIGAESMTPTNNSGGLANVASAADTHELLISENERIRSEIETLTANLASLELKQNMAIMTESMRMQEEVQSLRAVCHGLRMQMHYLLLEQQNRHHPPGPPPPSGSPVGANGNQPGMKGGPTGGGAGGQPGGGRPLSTNGPPRSRFPDTIMQNDMFKRFSRDLQDALVMPTKCMCVFVFELTEGMHVHVQMTADMDFSLYAFTDSAFLYDYWTANLEEGPEQYHENMAKRGETLVAKRDRRRKSMTSPLYDLLNEFVESELIDSRFVS